MGVGSFWPWQTKQDNTRQGVTLCLPDKTMWVSPSFGNTVHVFNCFVLFCSHTGARKQPWKQGLWGQHGSTWGQQEQGGPHVCPMNFAIWEYSCLSKNTSDWRTLWYLKPCNFIIKMFIAVSPGCVVTVIEVKPRACRAGFRHINICW